MRDISLTKSYSIPKPAIKNNNSENIANERLLYVPFFLLWPIAIAPKIVQLSVYVLVILFYFGKYGHELIRMMKVDGVAAPLFLMTFVQVLAVVIHSPLADMNRILAACNTVAIWMVAVIYYCIFSNIKINFQLLSRAATFNILILILLAVIATFFDFHFSILSDMRQLNGENWFGGVEGIRFFGLLEYSNLVTMMYLIMMPLSLIHIKQWRSMLLKLGYCLISTYPVVSASSRSGMLLAAAVLFAAFVYLFSESHTKVSIGVVLLFACCICAIVFLVEWQEIIDQVVRVLGGRQGSTDTRMYVYKLSIKTVIETSPLIGLGIKLSDATLGQGIPLGSHSTYIGIFYKTGIIGFLLAVFAGICLIAHLVRCGLQEKPKALVFSYTLILAAFLAVEDIDGANWPIVSIFILVGAIVGNYGRQSRRI